MAVTVSEIPGPGGTDAGGALTVSQEESAVADEIDNCPPPEFESGSDAVCDCGFDVRAANEIRLVPSVSSAGGDVTESDTEIVCEVPVHDPELHVTVTDPEYGPPAAVSDKAPLFSAIETTPGVVEPPATVSHDTDAEVEKEMFCETTLEATPTVFAAGGAEVPCVIENETLDAASTRSADCGRTVMLTPSNPDAAGVAESVTLAVKL